MDPSLFTVTFIWPGAGDNMTTQDLLERAATPRTPLQASEGSAGQENVSSEPARFGLLTIPAIPGRAPWRHSLAGISRRREPPTTSVLSVQDRALPQGSRPL